MTCFGCGYESEDPNGIYRDKYDMHMCEDCFRAVDRFVAGVMEQGSFTVRVHDGLELLVNLQVRSQSPSAAPH